MRNAPEVVREVGVHDFRMATKQQLFHLYVGLPPCLPRLLPAGALAGRGLHPLEERRLVTALVGTGRSSVAELAS